MQNRKLGMFAYVAAALLLLATVPLRADKPDAPPPGMGRYVMVLWVPGTPDSNGQPKGVQEPDIPALGGKVLHSRDNRRIIHLPLTAAKQLRRHESVVYLQRLWVGESFEGWDERFTLEGGLDASSDADTNLTWGPKEYLYDGSGNITRFGGEFYVYDSAGRLIKSTPVTGDAPGKTETYKYDSFGNLTEKTISGSSPGTVPVDGQSNRIVGVTYDAAGNVTTRNGREAYYWDNVGALAAATNNGPPRRMLYDADDERIGTIIDETLSRWTIRDFDGQIIREFRGDSDINGTMYWTWEQDHVRADGILVAGETQEWWDGSVEYGGLRHYHLDHLGSVRMVTNASGKSISEHDYFPFGVTRTRTYQEALNMADPHIDAMRFAGHWRDFLGMLNVENHDYVDYMHARYYDPNLGRFLSVDPVLDMRRALVKPQGWNRYSYVENNPINKVDPTGRYIESPIDLVVLGIDAGIGFYETYKTGEVSDTTKAAIAADLVTLSTPGAAGGGLFVRGGRLAMQTAGKLQVGARLTQIGTKLNQLMSQLDGTPGSSGSAPDLKTVVEEQSAMKKADGLTGKMKTGYEQVKNLLAQGLPGHNQHALTGDLKGWYAADLPGTGGGRGATRVIYKVEKDQVIIRDIVNYH